MTLTTFTCDTCNEDVAVFMRGHEDTCLSCTLLTNKAVPVLRFTGRLPLRVPAQRDKE